MFELEKMVPVIFLEAFDNTVLSADESKAEELDFLADKLLSRTVADFRCPFAKHGRLGGKLEFFN